MIKVKSPIAYLRDVRRNLAIPQAELAKQIGISNSSYKRKENGIKEFTLEEFTRMVVALHLDANDLALMFREVINDAEIPDKLKQYKWDFSKPKSEWLDWRYGQKKIDWNGKRYTLRELANEYDVNFATLKARYYRGWPIEELIKKPNKKEI